MITKQRLKEEIDRIPEEYLLVLYGVIRFMGVLPSMLSAKRRGGLSPESAPEIVWARFVDENFGCLAGSPIERGDQGLYESREEFK